MYFVKINPSLTKSLLSFHCYLDSSSSSSIIPSSDVLLHVRTSVLVVHRAIKSHRPGPPTLSRYLFLPLLWHVCDVHGLWARCDRSLPPPLQEEPKVLSLQVPGWLKSKSRLSRPGPDIGRERKESRERSPPRGGP